MSMPRGMLDFIQATRSGIIVRMVMTRALFGRRWWLLALPVFSVLAVVFSPVTVGAAIIIAGNSLATDGIVAWREIAIVVGLFQFLVPGVIAIGLATGTEAILQLRKLNASRIR
jgi:hypothetical protein